MHPAPDFRVSDPATLVDHLAARPFVTLTGAPDGRLRVAHSPVVVRRLAGGLALDLHLSRHNGLTPFLQDGFEAVAVSVGPEAYVSPDWYVSPDQVPTWNYVSVEAQGRLEALPDEALVTLLDDLSAQEEARLAPKPPWTRHKMTPGRFERMCRGIVGCRLLVDRLEGICKVSQNKSAADRAGVVAALENHPISGWMQA